MLLAMLVVSVAPVDAGTRRRRGTAGATELLIPVGSRGTALGGTFAAGISGIEAMYWNPAGVAATGRSAELMVSHLNYLADIDVNYVATYANFSGLGALGVSFKTLSFGNIPVTTVESADGTGETFSPNFVNFGLTFSRQMTDRILMGVTAKVISEKILRLSASGMAFDFGLQYRTSAGWKLGIALRNLGPNMQFDGADLENLTPIPGTEPGSRPENLRTVLSTFELPTTFEIGVAFDWSPAQDNTVTLMGGFQNNNFSLDEYKVGVEYNYKKMVYLRGAYSLAHNAEDGEFISSDADQFLFGPAIGGGINYDLTSTLNISVDYAYRPTELFEDNQWFSLTLGF
jgi:hypothetical protein